MAEHIQKIQDRQYASKQGQHLVPTTLGIALIQAYDNMNFEKSLSKPRLRRELEANMKRIIDGHMTLNGWWLGKGGGGGGGRTRVTLGD